MGVERFSKVMISGGQPMEVLGSIIMMGGAGNQGTIC